MQRGSDRLSPYRDDEMKHELRGLIRSGRSTRAEEWRNPEPITEDTLRAPTDVVRSLAADDVSLRFELARRLSRRAFPAKRRELLRALTGQGAPDELTQLVRALPEGGVYRNVQEVMEALGHKPAA